MNHPQPDDRDAELVFTTVSYGHRDARRLTAALHAEQLTLYGFADDPAATPPSAFQPPHGVFFLARLPGPTGAVGCAGVRMLDATTAEIKRMYVPPRMRGQRIGQRLVEILEQHAVDLGASSIVLETGCRNTAALALYRRCGFVPVPSYVPGRNPHVNRALSKGLAPDAR